MKTTSGKILKDCADVIIRPMILGQEQKIRCLVSILRWQSAT
ncbi:MAG: hypothetical protein ACLRMZ_27520 [Blautia marasmi]